MVHRGGTQEQSFRNRARQEPRIVALTVRVARGEQISADDYQQLRRVYGTAALTAMIDAAAETPL